MDNVSSDTIIALASGDFCEVEALYQGVLRIRAEMNIEQQALLMMGRTLAAALSNHPVYDPNTGAALPAAQSAAAAKKVEAYFKRAAVGPDLISRDMAKLWEDFNRDFLAPSQMAAGQAPTHQVNRKFRGLPIPGRRT